jgi:G3E family GTPase
MYMKNFGEFFNDQISHASCIIFSHTDVAKSGKIEEALSLVRGKNEKATIVTTPVNELSISVLIESIENKSSLTDELFKELNDEACPVCGHHHEHECHHDHEHHHEHECHHDHEHHHEHECHHDHEHHHEHECHHDHEHHHEHECHHNHEHHHEHEHHHHADEVFTSWGIETVQKYSVEQITDILNTLSNSDEYGMVLRAKGFIEGVNGEWIYFDYVPGEIDVRFGSSSTIGKICVIGSKLNEEKLEQLFK